MKNYYLHRSARDGYRSYLHSYASHSLKVVFNVDQLDLVRVARAFGFTTPPSVTLSILLCVCVCGGGSHLVCLTATLTTMYYNLFGSVCSIIVLR